MFSTEERYRVRELLLRAAEEDPAVSGAAITGSDALGAGDRWSDVDLVLGIEGPLAAALSRWTDLVSRELSAVHHWDLRSRTSIYRVFLLPDWLEVDIGFTPAADFGPLAASWRLVFGQEGRPERFAEPSADELAGLAWHHVLHARVCIERQRWWQGQHWISAVREQVIALACLRLGHPVALTKGAHLLPDEVTGPLGATLVRSLEAAELWRALRAVSASLATELALSAPALAERLRPMLAELTGPAAEGGSG